MFENLIEILKANPRKIVYTEGTDARILESAARLKKDGFLTPILVGNVEAVKAGTQTPIDVYDTAAWMAVTCSCVKAKRKTAFNASVP